MGKGSMTRFGSLAVKSHASSCNVLQGHRQSSVACSRCPAVWQHALCHSLFVGITSQGWVTPITLASNIEHRANLKKTQT